MCLIDHGEVGAGFVDEGGDAIALLRSDVRLQGVKSSKLDVGDRPRQKQGMATVAARQRRGTSPSPSPAARIVSSHSLGSSRSAASVTAVPGRANSGAGVLDVNGQVGAAAKKLSASA